MEDPNPTRQRTPEEAQAEAARILAEAGVTTPASANASAVEAEVTKALRTIEFEGVKIELPPTVEDLDVDAMEAFEGGKAVTAIRAIFGSANYETAKARFHLRTGRPLTIKDLEAPMEQVAKHFGFAGPGE